MKKVLSLVLVLAMVLGSFSFAFAASDDITGHQNEEAIRRLNKLDLVRGDAQGFRPNDTITRAEFAAIVVRALGKENVAKISNGTTVFADVPATHWAAGYINVASKLGYINGYGNGSFGPSDKITYEQALTLIIRALGYEPKAQKKGGYPIGYLFVADDLGITDDAEGVTGLPATRGLVFQLLDNSLTEPMMVQVGYGDSERYEVSGSSDDTEEVTLLDELGIDRYEARVIDIPRTDSSLEDDEIVLEDVKDPVVVDEDFDIEAAFGVEITAWCDGDDLVAYELNEDVIFDAATWEDDEFVLANDEDDVEYTITKDTLVFVNGAIEAEDNELPKDIDYAKVVVDSDEEEVLFVAAYTWDDSLVVDEVKEDVVYGTDVDANDFELDVEDFVIFKDGKTISVDEVEEGDILFFNEDAEFAEVYMNTVTGEIENIFKGSFEVDGDEYDITGTYVDGVLDVTALEDMQDTEEEVTLYLARTGEVRFVDGNLAEEETTDVVGYLTDDVTSYDGRKSTYYAIDMINQDGEEVSYDVEEAIVEDAVTAALGLVDDKNTKDVDESVPSAAQVKAYVDAAIEEAVIVVTLDEDGDVDEIDFAPYSTVAFDSSVKDGDDEIGELEVGDKYVKVELDDEIVSLRMSSSVKVFNAVDTDDVTASTWGEVEDFEIVDAAVVYYNADGYVKYLVVKDADVEEDTTDYDGVITEVKENADGIVRVKVLVDGKENTYYTADEIDMELLEGDVVTITVEDESKEVTAIELLDVIEGTVASVALGDNELTIGESVYELVSDAIVFDITDVEDIEVSKLRYVKANYEVKLVLDNAKNDRFVKFVLFTKVED